MTIDAEKDEDADGLGYYPDGVKRTLTDEQIAIFRHSEIHSLLQEKKLRADEEELGEDYKDEGDTGASQARLFVSGNLRKEHVSVHGAESPSTDHIKGQEQGLLDDMASAEENDEDYVKFLLEEKKQHIRDAARTKRKREGAHQTRIRGRCHTHRRIARELDTSMTEETLLVYDDGPDDKAIAAVSSHKIDGADPISSAGAVQKGRKIWWPTLGAG